MSTLLIEQPVFSHLSSMTTSRGLYEHAEFNEARQEHGYCVDDVARAFILLCRQPAKDLEIHSFQNVYLDFILDAITPEGQCHNRMSIDGFWTDMPSTSDWWGRAVWALGVGAVYGTDLSMRNRSLEGFRILTRAMTSDRMSLVFASLGAGEVLIADPTDNAARRILLAAKTQLVPADSNGGWLWPEPRLRYSNGSLVEAVLLSGWALRDMTLLNQGLLMLKFLLQLETSNGHFSVTPPGGRGPLDRMPAFDQQPLEVSALADVCARAWDFTGNPRWLIEVKRAWEWFLGNNDGGVRMFDPITGGGYDGLTPYGPNLNQGAESTIAMLLTAQRAAQLRDFFE
jgi:hypothetical protein